jgi:HMG (high mobility group) box
MNPLEMMSNNSFYMISDEYIPILIKKDLFKNPQKAVKKIDNIPIPTYVIDNFGEGCIRKPPNAFILFRKEVFKKVKIDNPNQSSREISIIIGKMWREMSQENKLSYKLKANDIKKNNIKYPNLKYNKFIRNIKKRDYIRIKESCNNPHILTLRKLLFI